MAKDRGAARVLHRVIAPALTGALVARGLGFALVGLAPSDRGLTEPAASPGRRPGESGVRIAPAARTRAAQRRVSLCEFNVNTDAFTGADGTASAIGWVGDHNSVVTCLGGTFLVQDGPSGLFQDDGFGVYDGSARPGPTPTASSPRR